MRRATTVVGSTVARFAVVLAALMMFSALARGTLVEFAAVGAAVAILVVLAIARRRERSASPTALANTMTERDAAHWRSHRGALDRLDHAVEQLLNALAPDRRVREQLDHFLHNEESPGMGSPLAVDAQRIEMRLLLDAVHSALAAGNALPPPPSCRSMPDAKYDLLPIDLQRRYFGAFGQVLGVLAVRPTSGVDEVDRGFALWLTGDPDDPRTLADLSAQLREIIGHMRARRVET
jgi:hypothetical protein